MTQPVMPQPFSFGWKVEFDDTSLEALRAMTAGLPQDPAVDETIEAWRCPACGRPDRELPAGHAWRTIGAASTCSDAYSK